MKTAIGLALVALALSGCGTTRALSYRGDGVTGDAIVQMNGHPLVIFIHPKEDGLMAEVTLGSAAASGFVDGLTMGLAKGHRLDPRDVDRALNAFVQPVGCTVDQVREIGNEQVGFEGAFHCPAGVDLRALINAQRGDLRRGVPLHP